MVTAFENGSRVCFVGDSITHTNDYITYIVDYYRTNLPERKVEFYNCGISGGRIPTSLATFDEDILPYNPTHVVLMIGINDSNRDALNLSENKYEILESAFNNYKANLSHFMNKLADFNIKLILCTPMPYAEYQPYVTPCLRGGYALMQGYAEYVRSLAKEKGIPLCDYHNYITKQMQKEILYHPDGIHPTCTGHYYMAKCFLAEQGFELGEDKPLPAYLVEWKNKTALIRDTIATEYLILKGDFTTSKSERAEAIQRYLDNYESNPAKSAYIHALAVDYSENVKQQKDAIEWVVQFMRNQ